MPLLTSRGLAMFTIAESGLSAEFYANDPNHIRRNTEALRNSVTLNSLLRRSTATADIGAFDQDVAAQLYDQIFPETARQFIDETDRLLIVTSDVFSSIPFAALVIDRVNTNDVEYLIDKTSIVQLTDLSLDSVSSKRSGRPLSKMVGFAASIEIHNDMNSMVKSRGTLSNLPPLPSTEAELKAIAARVDGNRPAHFMREGAYGTLKKTLWSSPPTGSQWLSKRALRSWL